MLQIKHKPMKWTFGEFLAICGIISELSADV